MPICHSVIFVEIESLQNNILIEIIITIVVLTRYIFAVRNDHVESVWPYIRFVLAIYLSLVHYNVYNLIYNIVQILYIITCCNVYNNIQPLYRGSKSL